MIACMFFFNLKYAKMSKRTKRLSLLEEERSSFVPVEMRKWTKMLKSCSLLPLRDQCLLNNSINNINISLYERVTFICSLFSEKKGEIEDKVPQINWMMN